MPGRQGLSQRLALGTWSKSDSTVGAGSSQWKLPLAASSDGVEREIWLWDFGGQADQRLIHQLYMDETALAVLVFDPQKEDAVAPLLARHAVKRRGPERDRRLPGLGASDVHQGGQPIRGDEPGHQKQ